MALCSESLQLLRGAMEAYTPLCETTWQQLMAICQVRQLTKGQSLYAMGQLPDSFGFVVRGLLRSFTVAADGREYNKNFFAEGSFPGSMTALLTQSPSRFAVQTLEASSLVLINFDSYRRLLLNSEDLKLFHIYYLEQNWLLAKDAREVELVQEDASVRYRRFLAQYPDLQRRLPQYHIAAHLGITPTQLSRIRKLMDTRSG